MASGDWRPLRGEQEALKGICGWRLLIGVVDVGDCGIERCSYGFVVSGCGAAADWLPPGFFGCLPGADTASATTFWSACRSTVKKSRSSACRKNLAMPRRSLSASALRSYGPQSSVSGTPVIHQPSVRFINSIFCASIQVCVCRPWRGWLSCVARPGACTVAASDNPLPLVVVAAVSYVTWHAAKGLDG